MSNKVSVIIINYNSSKYVIRLVDSLKLINKYINEIIIIDNNSTIFQKNSLNKLKGHSIIYNQNNVGFAKAVNQAISLAKSEKILLLNPDTLITDDKFGILLNHFKDKRVTIVGGAMKTEKNKLYYSANRRPGFGEALLEFTILKRLFPNNYFSNRFWIESKKEIKSPLEVDSVCGAFMIFRKNIKGVLARFNEGYFLYLEDLDFCLSARNRECKVIFDPRYSITHYGGRSNNSKYGSVLKYWYESRNIFFNKYCNNPFKYILDIIFLVEPIALKIYHSLKNEPTE